MGSSIGGIVIAISSRSCNNFNELIFTSKTRSTIDVLTSQQSTKGVIKRAKYLLTISSLGNSLS